jgi:hypothetical protein
LASRKRSDGFPRGLYFQSNESQGVRDVNFWRANDGCLCAQEIAACDWQVALDVELFAARNRASCLPPS